MSYIENLDNTIADLDQKIKRLQRTRLEFKKEKQLYCPHLNIVRRALMPRMRFDALAEYSPTSTVKVRTTCKDCGKVLK